MNLAFFTVIFLGALYIGLVSLFFYTIAAVVIGFIKFLKGKL